MKKTITTTTNVCLMPCGYGKTPECIKEFKKAVRKYGYHGGNQQKKYYGTDKYRIKGGEIDYTNGMTYWKSYQEACIQSLLRYESGEPFDDIPIYQYAIACAKSILKGALDPERLSVLKQKKEKGVVSNSGFSPAISRAYNDIGIDTKHLSEIEYCDKEIGIHFTDCDENGKAKQKCNEYQKEKEKYLQKIISRYALSDGYDIVQEAVTLIYEQWNKYHITGDTANIFEVPIKYRYINHHRKIALEKLVDPYDMKAWTELVTGFYQEKELPPHKIIMRELGVYVRSKGGVKFDSSKRTLTFDFTLIDLLQDRILQAEESDTEYITQAENMIIDFSESELKEVIFCRSERDYELPSPGKKRKPLSLSLLKENSVDEIAKKCGIKKPFHLAVFRLQCSGVGGHVIWEKLKGEYGCSLSEVEKQITRNKAKIRERYPQAIKEIEREKASKQKASKQKASKQ